MTVPSRSFFQRWKFRQLDEDDIPGFHESLPPKSTINGPRSGSPDAHPDKQPTAPLATVVVDSASSVESASIWQASLAIGGITCAACVNIITEELGKKDWIKNVSVNLIAHSATIDFIGEAHKDDIVEAIEDLGYDAALDSVVDLNELKPARESGGMKRTVDVLVKGMFCEECPARVLAALAECFADRVHVDKPLTTGEPILRLSYIPEVPSFTIRHIIAAISTANEALELSIYHPQSLEDRSRQMHVQEQRRLIIRVLVTFVIAIPTLIIGIIYMILIPSTDPGHQFLDQPLFDRVSRAQWALFIMATPVYFLCADTFHKRAIKELQALWRKDSATPFLERFYRFGSMSLLMSLGTTVAYISSITQLVAAEIDQSKEKVNDHCFYFDSVVFLTLFLLLGRLIESYSKSKTDDAVSMLGKMRPTDALLVDKEMDSRKQRDAVTSVNVDLLEFGDIIKVRPGGSPPCDGTMVQGKTEFDESSLTGESRRVKKFIGDQVFSGTINKGSPVSIKVTGIAGSSMLDQIVNAVREGQARRAPIERIADTLTSYFIPCIIVIAFMTWIVWLALGCSGTLPQNYLDGGSSWIAWSLQFAIAVFVVACPCGLALAAPTALFVGGGLAAKHGILAKGGGEAFEMASKLDCVVFDKTGTLTIGNEPVVTDFAISEDFLAMSLPTTIDQKFALSLIHDIEGNSSHTIAKAIVSFCRTTGMQGMDAAANEVEVEEIPGKGMKGTVQGRNTSFGESSAMIMIIGNESLMLENNVVISSASQKTLDAWKTQGKSIALAAITFNTSSLLPTYHLCAIISISDPIRPEAPGIITALQKRGTAVWMLSGDNQITANAVGSLVGIPRTNIIAGVLPHQKSEQIRYLQRSLKASGGKSETKRALIAMVGDGINDSPALTTADVGIAIGSGSDIAISSAEFVLITSNLNSLITLLDLSRTVFRRIKFNFAWAFVYNIIALPVAAGVLYPLVASNGKHVRLDPVWASLAMALSSVSVVCSSLALRSRVPGVGFKVRKDVQKLES